MDNGSPSLIADFQRELAEQGLPENASLADLIRHHRGNAGLAAGANYLCLSYIAKEVLDRLDKWGAPFPVATSIDKFREPLRALDGDDV